MVGIDPSMLCLPIAPLVARPPGNPIVEGVRTKREEATAHDLGPLVVQGDRYRMPVPLRSWP